MKHYREKIESQTGIGIPEEDYDFIEGILERVFEPSDTKIKTVTSESDGFLTINLTEWYNKNSSVFVADVTIEIDDMGKASVQCDVHKK